MTKNEASFILANIDRRVCDDELNEALDMAINALEQEPCVLNTKKLSDDEIEQFKESMKNVRVQVIQKEPCEDAISRQAILNSLANIAKVKAKSDAQKSLIGRCIYMVEQLPPVQPTRKRGKWVEYENGKGIECSECCVRWDFSENMTERFDFCPNCASDNREVSE